MASLSRTLLLCIATALPLPACGPRGGEDAAPDAPDGGDGSPDGDVAADGDAPATPCPADMALVDDGLGAAFCIDRFERPGEGLAPETGVAWREARLGCVDARRVLCLEEEWERACAGTPEGACLGPEAPSGTRRDCVSSFGVHDLPGNVAEWTASPGGSVTYFARGGSAETEQIGCALREEIRAEARRSDLGYRCCRRPSP